jgi:hypothetical protein
MAGITLPRRGTAMQRLFNFPSVAPFSSIYEMAQKHLSLFLRDVVRFLMDFHPSAD